MEYSQFSNAVNENLPSKDMIVSRNAANPNAYIFNQDVTLDGNPFMDDPSIPLAAVLKPVDFKKGQKVSGYAQDLNCNPNGCTGGTLSVDIRNEENNGGVRVQVPMQYLTKDTSMYGGGVGKPRPQDAPSVINEGASGFIDKIKRNLPVISIGIAAGVVIGLIIFKKR